jgi:tRNA-specific 2-thiouridylase
MLKGMASKVNKGLVVDSAGEFLGYHEGVHAYTIGQRKGIEVPNGPWFVLEINAIENKIVIGREHELAKTSFEITEVNLLQEEIPEIVLVKIRAQHRMVKARLHPKQESQESVFGENATNARMLVETLEPVIAVSPGQICAFYDEDKLLGGGTIL